MWHFGTTPGMHYLKLLNMSSFIFFRKTTADLILNNLFQMFASKAGHEGPPGFLKAGFLRTALTKVEMSGRNKIFQLG